MFLTLSTVEAIQNALATPDYFPHGPSLFPEWPIWRPNWALSLMAVTAMILFLPKILSIVLIVARRSAKEYGGMIRLSLSVLLEVCCRRYSPIRMAFHSRFVFRPLLRRTVSWPSQGVRTLDRRRERFVTASHLVPSAWGISLYLLNPDYFWWVTPIIGALILSIPFSVLASRVSLGDRTRAWGLFLIPEEDPPGAAT
jgi:membrane glycosyltransferase